MEKTLNEFAKQYLAHYEEQRSISSSLYNEGKVFCFNGKLFELNIVAKAMERLNISYIKIDEQGSPFVFATVHQANPSFLIWDFVSVRSVVPPECASSISINDRESLLDGLALAHNVLSSIHNEHQNFTCCAGIITLYTTDDFSHVSSATSRLFDFISPSSEHGKIEKLSEAHRSLYKSIVYEIGLEQYYKR